MAESQPDLVTLAAMAASDETRRYEVSRDGAVSVTPIGDPVRSRLVSRIAVWLLTYGVSPERVAVDCAIDTGGGRVPDLAVWAEGRSPMSSRAGYASAEGIALIIEVAASDGGIADRPARFAEYAASGVPRLWIVSASGVVDQYVLSATTGGYRTEGQYPLAGVLDSEPVI